MKILEDYLQCDCGSYKITKSAWSVATPQERSKIYEELMTCLTCQKDKQCSP